MLKSKEVGKGAGVKMSNKRKVHILLKENFLHFQLACTLSDHNTNLHFLKIYILGSLNFIVCLGTAITVRYGYNENRSSRSIHSKN